MPQTFKVGAMTTEPLVQPGQLLQHLKLLNTFSAMRQRVEDGDIRFPVLARQMSAEKRWTWFVSLAVERCVSISNIHFQSTNRPLASNAGVVRVRYHLRTFSHTVFHQSMLSWFGMHIFSILGMQFLSMRCSTRLIHSSWYIEDTMRISQLTALAAFNPYMDMVRK
jgi:hypothetical protein